MLTNSILFARRFRQMFFFLMLVLSLSGTSCSKTKSPVNPAKKEADRRTVVEILVIEPGMLRNEVFTTGTLLANERVELRNEVPGRIIKIAFEEGRTVKKGELLLKINDSELQAQLQKVQIQIKQAEQEEFRKRKLLELSAVSQEEYDISLNELESLKAETRQLNAQIEKTEIRAPFDGTIGLRAISPGAYLASNTLITTLQQLDPVKIEFSVPEKYSSELVKGMKINFTSDNLPGEREAMVYAVEPAVKTETRTITARAVCNNRNGELIPGSYVRISLILEENANALKIPSGAIIAELQGQKVYVAKNGVASETRIETGLRTDSEVEVLRGVAPGDSLIVSGLMQIRHGMPVQIKSTGKP